MPKLQDFATPMIVEMLTSPDWFWFCFVRNPYDRHLSAYKDKMLNYLYPQHQPFIINFTSLVVFALLSAGMGMRMAGQGTTISGLIF